MATSMIKCTVEIGSDVETASDPASDTYTQIDGLIEAGELGGTTERGSVNIVDSGEMEIFKGVTDPGETELTFRYKSEDAGQAACEAAAVENLAYNFKFTLSNGDIFYQQAYVMSCRLATGTTEDVVRWIVSLALTGQPTFVAAT